MQSRVLTFLTTSFLCLALSVQGQRILPVMHKRCPVKTINFENGLLHNSTVNVITDVFGFTWISTVTGMQRYNGYLLQTINPVVDQEKQIINSPVFFLGLDNGNIWICFKKGILEYNPYTNVFRKIVSIQGSEQPQVPVVALKQTKEGIWCLQYNLGIVVYNSEGKLVKSLPALTREDANEILGSITLLERPKFTVNGNYLFLAVFKNRILQINTQSNQFFFMDAGGEDILGMASGGEYLYTTSTTGISAIDVNERVVKKRFLYSSISKEKVAYSVAVITPQGQLLVTLNRRLLNVDNLLEHAIEYTDLNSNALVTTGYTLFIYADKIKRIWLLTNNDIKRLQHIDIPFEHFIYTNEKNNFVRSLYFDNQQKVLLAGCFNGGLQLYDTLANPLWEKSLITNAVKDVIGIEKLDKDNYLLVTLGNGWFLLNGKTKRIKPFQFPPASALLIRSKQNIFPNNLQRINDSTILVAISKNIFRCVFRGTSLADAVPFFSQDQSFETTVNCFIFTSAGSVWAGNSKGLVYKRNKAGRVDSINIPGNYAIRSMAEDNMQSVWVGTDKGVFVFDNAGRLLKSAGNESGLLNDCIYGLIPGNEPGSMFASSNLGLSYIPRTGRIKNYTKESGLQDNEFNTSATLKSPDGKYYFGGVNGITAFYPGNLAVLKDTPVISVINLVINDSVYERTSDIWRGDSIRLEYNQNHLQIDFACNGLLNTNEYEYQYRLQGFESLWKKTEKPTGINYILEPGDYVLELNCSPALSSNSVFTKRIFIFITPPVWKTWWFITLAFLVVICLLILLISFYNKRKYNKKLQEMVVQQNMQAERERISRELHDNVGAQLSYISSNVDWLLDTPVELTKNEERARLIDINDTAKRSMMDLRETIWAMKKESIGMEELADKLKNYVRRQTGMRENMEISFTEQIAPGIVLSPAEALNIYRICQESVNNAVKHASAAELNIKLEALSENDFSISIADNGKGFDPADIAEGHYGLENMQARASELMAQLIIQSKKDEGTTVVLKKLLK
jgi:two-component sensor histidine kinase